MHRPMVAHHGPRDGPGSREGGPGTVWNHRGVSLTTPARGTFAEPAPSALLLLGRGVDLASERGVECVGDLPAASDPDLVERARVARAALGDRAFVLGHHYQRDEVIRFADVTG